MSEKARERHTQKDTEIMRDKDRESVGEKERDRKR